MPAVVAAIGRPGSPPPTTSSYHAASPRPTGRQNTVGESQSQSGQSWERFNCVLHLFTFSILMKVFEILALPQQA